MSGSVLNHWHILFKKFSQKLFKVKHYPYSTDEEKEAQRSRDKWSGHFLVEPRLDVQLKDM